LAGLGKKATAEGRTIVWVDQSGFYLLPMAVRTWAPCRHTPILRVPLTHDHLAAIGGLTPEGRLFLQTQDHAYRSPDVVRFLRVLLRKIRGKLLVIWDGAPIHRGQPIKDYLACGAAKRLHLEQLPGYAPELNPVEGLWNDLKPTFRTPIQRFLEISESATNPGTMRLCSSRPNIFPDCRYLGTL